VIRLEVAGIRPDDIDITIEDRTLTISGTRSFGDETDQSGYHRREIFTGEFKRTLILPDEFSRDEIAARVDDGILEVTVPRRPEVLPRKVKVDVSS
jgi:HSP20 family protein